MVSLRERLFSKIRKTRKCWIWTAGKNSDGYGHLKVNGFMKKAHRLVYELEVGSIPDGLNLLHKCDNPWCVRPNHLFPGTQMDNVQDMIRKGRKGVNRVSRGEASNLAKLTATKVRKMRLLRNQGTTLKELAARFGTSKTNVSEICRRKTWTHLLVLWIVCWVMMMIPAVTQAKEKLPKNTQIVFPNEDGSPVELRLEEPVRHRLLVETEWSFARSDVDKVNTLFDDYGDCEEALVICQMKREELASSLAPETPPKPFLSTTVGKVTLGVSAVTIAAAFLKLGVEIGR